MPNAGIMASAVVSAPPCTDVLAESFDNLSNWTTTAGTPDIRQGYTGTGVGLLGSFTTIDFTIPTLQQSDTITVGFHWKSSTMTSSGPILMLRSDSGATDHTRLNVISDGSIATTIGTSGIATSAAGVLAPNTWAYIEIQAKLHDTAGYHKVRVNGHTIIDISNTDTKNSGTKTVYDTVRLIGMNQVTVDNMYVSSGSGCPFKGDHIVGTCNSVLNEPFNDFTTNAWALAGTTGITGGRTGTGAKITNFSGTATYTIPSAKENDTITLGCAIKVTGMGSEAIFMTLRSDSAATVHGELRWNSAGQLIYVSHSSQIGVSATGVIPLNTWVYVEVQVKMHDSIGYLKVRVNEKTVIEILNVDTRNAGTKTKFDSVRLECTWFNVFYDDMYITTGDCVFRGDQQIVSNCTEIFTDDFETLNPAWTSGFLSAGRTGNAMTLSGSSNAQRDWTPASWNVTVGFAYKTNTVSAVTRNIFSFRDSSGNDYATLQYSSTGAIIFAGSTGAPVWGTSATGLIVANAWSYLEVNFFADNTNGYFEVRQNGVSLLSGSTMDTQVSASPGVGIVRMFLRGAGSGTQVQYDDMYVKTGAGCGWGEDPNICNPILQEPFNNFTDAPWVMGTVDVTESPSIIGGGRNGSGCQCAGRSYIYYRVPMDYFSNVLTLGFAWKVSAVANDIITGWEAKGDTAHYNQVGLFTTASGAFEFRKYPSMTPIASGGSYTSNTWYYIEIQMKLGVNGFVRLRVNGTIVINTNANTLNSTDPTTGDKFVAFGIGSTEARVMTIDDLYLTSGGGCAWQADHVPLTLQEPFNNLSRWTLTGTPTIVAGRNGTACQCSSSTARADYSLGVSANTTITVGFAFRVTGAGTSGRTVLQLYSDANSIENVRLKYDGTTPQSFSVGLAGLTFSGGTTGALLPVDTWAYVELRVFTHDTLGTCVLKVNGITVVNVSNVDSRGAGSATGAIDTVRIGALNISQINQYDDLYITSGPAMFQGDHVIP